MATTVGTIELIATINTADYKKGENEIKSSNKNIENSTDSTSSKGSKSWALLTASMSAVATVASKITSKAIDLVSSSIDSAVRRVDTLNNADRVFANMGFAANDVSKTMNSLQKSIKGLPTPLDAAIRNVQLLASSTNNLQKSEKIFSALNNAILGFGGTADMAENAIIQLSQAFSNGKIDASTWNSMINSGLGPTLNALAKQMGITAGQLKEGLSEGSISVEQFQDALINLNENGGGGLKSLQQIAKDSTAGINTGMSNMGTAVSRGVAKIIEAIGSENISNAISAIGSGFESVLGTIAETIPKIINYIKGLIEYVEENKDFISPVAVAVAAATSAFIIWTGAIKTWQTITKAATAIQTAFNAVMSANPIMLVVAAIAAVVAGLIYFFTQTETGKKLFESFGKVLSDVWNGLVAGIKGVGEWFGKLWNSAKKMIDNIVNGFMSIVKTIADFGEGIWNGVVSVFNSIVDFLKKWGLTIVAVIFWPISLIVGLFFTFKEQIIGVFTVIWNSIVSIITPIVSFFQSIFDAIGNGLRVVGEFFSNLWASVKQTTYDFFVWLGLKVLEARDTLINIWNTVVGFFQGVWSGIVNVFSSVGAFFGSVFSAAANNIRNFFNPIIGFFQGIWNSIVSIFTSIGSAVGNAISGAVKGAVNGILRFATNMINGFIDAINVAIDVINAVPGVSIGKLGKLPTQQLAKGGVAPHGIYEIGEAGKEVVMPLERNTGWIDNLAKDLDDRQDNSKKQPQIIYNLSFDMSKVLITNEQTKRDLTKIVIDQVKKINQSHGMTGEINVL